MIPLSREYVGDKKSLLKELQSAGFDELSQKEIEKKLEEYVQRHPFGANLPKYGSIDKNFLTSSLEALMNANDKIILKEKPKPVIVEEAPETKAAPKTEASSSLVTQDMPSVEDEWEKIIREKFPLPINRLEKDRDDFLTSQIMIPDDIAKTVDNAEVIEGVKYVFAYLVIQSSYLRSNVGCQPRSWLARD